MSAWCKEQWSSLPTAKAVAKYGAADGVVACPDCGRDIKLTLRKRMRVRLKLKMCTQFNGAFHKNAKEINAKSRVPPHKLEAGRLR